MIRATRSTARTAAAGAALALGAGVLVAGPAQAAPAVADQQPVAVTQAPAGDAPSQHPLYSLQHSAHQKGIWYLKVQGPDGFGEYPAPAGKYSVTVTSGGQSETRVVQVKDGVVDLSSSALVRHAAFEPAVSIHWIGR